MMLRRKNHQSGDQHAQGQSEKRKQWCYALAPSSMLMTAMFVLCLLIVPILRGAELSSELLLNAMMQMAITLIVVSAAAWLVWRYGKQSDAVANLVFSTLVAMVAIWSVIMTPPQRASAQQRASQAIDSAVHDLRQDASDMIAPK